MSIEKARALLQDALIELADPPPTPPPISTPDAFDRALAAAQAGDTLLLDPTLVYPAPLTLQIGVTLQSTTYADRLGLRMTADEPAPRFTGGGTALVDAHQLCGIELRHPDVTHTIGVMGGQGSTWARVRILGDPKFGAHRGIDFRGASGIIVHAYIDDVFQPTQDTQAVYSQEMLAGGGLIIADCFLRAAGQSVMLGGGDPSTAAGIPSRVQLRDSVLTKRPEWMTVISLGKHAQQVKCALELKNVIGFKSSDCTFDGAGVSQQQKAFAFVFTPRNQNGTRPESCVTDVEITDFTAGNGCAGLATFLGNDDQQPSGPLRNVTLARGKAVLIDHAALPGSPGRVFAFNRAPDGVTLDTLTVEAPNLAAFGYFEGTRPPTRLQMRGLTLPAKSTYGWKVDGGTGKGGQGRKALLNYMADAVLDPSIV